MLKFTAVPTETTRAYQAGGPDAFGLPPEETLSDGPGNPCRHCLRDIPKGAGMLVLAHKPFDSTHPYTEIGPVFFCKEACRDGASKDLPDILTTSPDYLLKGYTKDDRILYGTGAIIPSEEILGYASQLFDNPNVAYIHVRSARNNCYQCRIDRDT